MLRVSLRVVLLLRLLVLIGDRGRRGLVDRHIRHLVLVLIHLLLHLSVLSHLEATVTPVVDRLLRHIVVTLILLHVGLRTTMSLSVGASTSSTSTMHTITVTT